MAKRALSVSTFSVPAHEALRQAIRSLQTAHVQSASLDARLLLLHVMGIAHEQWVVSPDMDMTSEQATLYESLIARRAAREPIAHIIGKREFWSMDFKVTNATLDPRPDSETIIEALLQRIPDKNAALNILDLGTGTGCLLLTLLKELPNAKGLGIDLSREAMAVAQENALSLGLSARAHFQHGNWCEGVSGSFDVIISNPPYIPTTSIRSLAPEVAQYEPKLALDGGEDGLDCYRNILAALPTILNQEGIAAFEVGAGQIQSVAEIASENGLQLEGMRKDMQGIPRCLLLKHFNNRN
ncbi:MAG: peptide chain release factor N(5)-glutamine methyltransferase [Alphaproteobacteria bacterium]